LEKEEGFAWGGARLTLTKRPISHGERLYDKKGVSSEKRKSVTTYIDSAKNLSEPRKSMELEGELGSPTEKDGLG